MFVLLLLVSPLVVANTDWNGPLGNMTNSSYIKIKPFWNDFGDFYTYDDRIYNNRKLWRSFISGDMAILFYRCDLNSPYSYLEAIDLSQQGKLRWKKPVSIGFPFTPAIDNKAIYLVVRNKKNLAIYLQALDINNGHLLYESIIPGALATEGSARGYALIDKNNVYVMYVENIESGSIKKIAAFDKASGHLLWQDNVNLSNASRPALFKQAIYIITQSHAYKIDTNNGDILQRQSIPLCLKKCTPVVLDENRILYNNNGSVLLTDLNINQTQFVTQSNYLPKIGHDSIYIQKYGKIELYNKQSLDKSFSFKTQSNEEIIFAVTDNAVITYYGDSFYGHTKIPQIRIYDATKGKEIKTLIIPTLDNLKPIGLNEKALITIPENIYGPLFQIFPLT